MPPGIVRAFSGYMATTTKLTVIGRRGQVVVGGLGGWYLVDRSSGGARETLLGYGILTQAEVTRWFGPLARLGVDSIELDGFAPAEAS